jgi:hypothetical protein
MRNDSATNSLRTPPTDPRVRFRPAGLLAALLLLTLSSPLAWGADRIQVLDDEEADSTRSGFELSVTPTEEGGVNISLGGDIGERIAGLDSVAAALRRVERRQSSALRRAQRYDAKRTSEIVSFGQDITVERDQIVDGDVVCFLGSVYVRGMVQGSVVALGGEVELDSDAIVHGDAVSLGGDAIRVKGGGVIAGEAVAIGGRIIERPGSHIGDRIELKFIPSVRGPGVFRHHGLGSLGVTLLLHLIFIGFIGLVFVKLGARRWAASVVTLRSRGWESLFAGIGAGILFLIVGIPLLLVIILALIALVVGIPLVPLVAFLLLAFPVPGYVITAILLGRALRSGPPTDPRSPVQPGQGGAFLLGHTLLSSPWVLATLLSGIFGGLAWPAGFFLFLGWGVAGLAIAFGWGAFLLSRFGSRVPQRALEALAARGVIPEAPPAYPPAPPPPGPSAPPPDAGGAPSP